MNPTLIQKLVNENGTLRQFMQMRRLIEAYAGFAVGDFLIERYAGGFTENFAGSGVPAYFKVVHRDDASGLVFACRVNANGALGRPFCLQGRPMVTFELDANYINSQLLGEHFDPTSTVTETKAELKRRRAHNKKIGKSLYDMGHEGACAWALQNLAPGTQFWVSYGASLACYGPHTTTKVYPAPYSVGWSTEIGFKQLQGKTLLLDVLAMTDQGNPISTTLRLEALIRGRVVFYLSEPMRAKVTACG